MDLTSTLREEKQILTEIVKIMKQEKEALIKDNINALEEITRAKEEMKRRLDSIEKDRIKFYGHVGLKEILPGLKENEREEAQAIGEDMAALVLEISELNDTNYLLIAQSLSYARGMINALSPEKPMVYNPTGKMQDTGLKSGILNKSV